MATFNWPSRSQQTVADLHDYQNTALGLTVQDHSCCFTYYQVTVKSGLEKSAGSASKHLRNIYRLITAHLLS